MGAKINPKKTLARKMMTKDEVKRHVSPFYCEAWNKRYRARQTKLINSHNHK